MALWKPIAWFAAGGIGGAVGAALLLDGAREGSVPSVAPSLVEAVTGLARGRSAATRVGDAPELSERLDAYREAQEQTDVADLSRDLERAVARSPSASRDLEIDALLGRISELAPGYAAELAVALALDVPFVADAWLDWAAADPDAAIAGLASIPGAAARLEVALVLTAIVGDDARGVERLAEALPAADRNALRANWMAKLARQDPFAAFREAMAIGEPTLQRLALGRIGVAWAAQDPYAALAQADLLPPELVQQFRSAVFSEWARIDPDGYVAWLESATDLPQEAQSGLQQLLMANPELASRVAENLPGDIGRAIRASALGMLAASDPEGAKSQAEAMPPGQDRDIAVQSVASALAQVDPEAALAWAQALDPPSPNAMRSITMNLARGDPARLFAMLDNPGTGVDTQLLVTAATSVTGIDPAQIPEFADGLLARSDALSAQALQRLVGSWMQRDPESALDWVLAHGTEVEATVFTSAAQTLANRDPVGAAAYLERIPQAQRGTWISEVATQYGRADPLGALAWVSQFQGQEAYDVALRQVVNGAAQTDPRAAAQMLAQASGSVQQGAAQQVAAGLAAQNPREAAQWARWSLTDPRARTMAEGVIARTWYASDAEGGRRYVLDMPAGADRDQVITNMVTTAASSGTFDRRLLDAISDPALRQQVVGFGITRLARTDLVQARALLASEITDPAVRQQIETQIRQLAQ